MKTISFGPKEKSLIDFASDYLESFSNPFIEKIITRAIRKGSLGELDLKTLTQLKGSISINEIKDPKKFYVDKYTKLIPILSASSKCGMWIANLPSDEEEVLSIFENFYIFYEKRGYLTPKQINYFNILRQKMHKTQLPLEMTLRNFYSSPRHTALNANLILSFIKNFPKETPSKVKKIKITPKKFKF